MGKYVIKRIGLFIPTLIAISLITFVISVNAPGDPVERMLTGGGMDMMERNATSTAAYIQKRKELKLDLPLFYLSIHSASYSKRIFEIPFPEHRRFVERLLWEYGNEQAVFQLYDSLVMHPNHLQSLIASNIIDLESSIMELKEEGLIKALFLLQVDPKPHLKYIPILYWHGFENQYHHWITQFITGDFGVSYLDKRPVADKIWDALSWTLILSVCSILLSYLIAIPIGIISAVKRSGWLDQGFTILLFVLYSLPSFWIASLLLSYFANPDYWVLFDPLGFKALSSYSDIGEKANVFLQHVWVPLFCLSYGSLTFLSRQMRTAMLEVLDQDFIRTAKAKGLTERKVVLKHAFKNSLLPIITLFANVFPYLIGGSIVIEQIFSIPGMGKLGLEAIMARDYPVIYTVTMFAGVMTLIGYLIADILYSFVDPRIRLNQ